MKRYCLVILGLIMGSVLLWSCGDREGRFRPAKRLSTVTESSVLLNDGDTVYVQPDLVVERYTWERKQLMAIDYYNGNALVLKETYTYDDKNRMKMASLSGTHTAIYHYTDKKLDSISLYSGDRWSQSLAFSHGRSKVRQMTVSSLEGVVNYKISWDGDNVGRMIVEGDSAATLTFTYDNSINPYEGLFSWWEITNEGGLVAVVGANNLLACSTDGVVTTTYSYTYSDGYPITRTWVKEYDYMYNVWNPLTLQYDQVVGHSYERRVRTYQYED